MASFQNVFIRNFIRSTKRMFFNLGMPVEQYRSGMEKMTRMAKMPEGIIIEKINCSGVQAEWIIPKNITNQGMVLYLHGGGYAMGSVNTHRALMARIAIASKTKVLGVEYRLAPEYPFPCAIDDVFAVYSWLLQQGFDNNKIVIAGDSAGGGLTIALKIRIRDENAPKPAAGVCLSPWLDLASTGETTISLAEEDPMLDLESVRHFALFYAPPEKLQHPWVSPLYADLTNLSPIYIQVSTSEILLDDTRRFAEKAKNTGIEIQVDYWDKMVHVWQAFGVYLPEALEAIEKLGAYIEKKTA
ncbi:MAG: Monoterpene epsilon-lactone hydrolase [Bacteroidia bacterium]|nr:Monoterpene epsilon-lactone hydrolase [Bacteroidia bacterium]